MGDSIKELVNAFNLNNYFFDGVNTNFTVEGKNIVGLFAIDTDVTKYLCRVGEEIVKQQYLGRTEVASRHYNLDCFPFVLDNDNKEEEYFSNNVKRVKLASSINNGVIRNLKLHCTNEFKRAVALKVIAYLEKALEITEEEGHEWIRGTVKIGAMGRPSPYLYCIAFDGKYFEKEGYDSETFELFKEVYITEFNSRLEVCGLKRSDFYEYKDDMLYIKNVNDKVIKSAAEYVKKEAAFDFRTLGKEDSKVENFKYVLSSLISKWAEKSISAYYYDVLMGEQKIENGNSFVLIPLIKAYSDQFESLKHRDAYKINAVHKGFVSDIRGKTANPKFADYKEPVYAFSNKGIAKLLPKIMEFPITYNERKECFEFAADLGPSAKVDSPRPTSELLSPAAQGLDVSKEKKDNFISRISIPMRDLLDVKRIKEKHTLDGRNLSNISADSAISSVSSASQSTNKTGNTDDSGIYSSQEFVTDAVESDNEYEFHRDFSRASSISTVSTKSSTSSSSVDTVVEEACGGNSQLSANRPELSSGFFATVEGVTNICNHSLDEIEKTLRDTFEQYGPSSSLISSQVEHHSRSKTKITERQFN